MTVKTCLTLFHNSNLYYLVIILYISIKIFDEVCERSILNTETQTQT